MKKFVQLETARLILRRFRPGDENSFLEYRVAPEVMQYQGNGFLWFTAEDAARFVLEQSSDTHGKPDTWFQIALESKDTGALIGDLGLHTLDDIQQAEIGFTIAPPHQNQGYAIEAVRALLHYLFIDCCLHRVIAIADVRNKPSVQLLERLGMRREGCFLQSSWNNGEYTDEYQYALLGDEYRQLAEKL